MAASVYKWLTVYSFWFILPGLRNERLISIKHLHPYYISVVEINHSAANKMLEISCKIFTDDFENTLRKDYPQDAAHTRIDLANPADKGAMDKLVNDYIRKHLSFKVDGKAVDFSYVGYEKEDIATDCYFEVDHVPAVKTIDVTNSILHDFSDQQINIIHCIVGGKRQSTKLDYPKTEASFSW